MESASRLWDLEFTSSEIDSMLPDLADQLEAYDSMRTVEIPNSVRPALVFDPFPPDGPSISPRNRLEPGPPMRGDLTDDIEEIAFYTVRELGELIRTGKLNSTRLTRIYLDRLKRYGPELECVVTLTEEVAIEQAARADREITAGYYRGPLHGIPYGAKDLLSYPGYRTTWGAGPYREQVLAEKATVLKKLEEAGAVLVAKLTLGALAWGDVWYGGTTRNPWNTGQGSSGSSAGSAAATSAGLVGFSIGTETWGSIVSPSTRCGVTGLRPSFGRVSRAGAMALSWSMDKIGPICRSAEGCAIVFDAMRGSDGIDPSVRDAGFEYVRRRSLDRLRIGYVGKEFDEGYGFGAPDSTALAVLEASGYDLVEISLPDLPVYPLSIILNVEAAAAFDSLTRTGRDEQLVRQVRNAWPNVFRAARTIPAVEYVQANRIRYMLCRAMDELDVDVFVAPSFGPNLLLTNLTGHPCVVVPNGFDEEGNPVSITFTGRLFGEGPLLEFAAAYQEITGFHLKHPPEYE